MKILVSFGIVFIIVYLFYLFFIVLRKNKLKKIKQSKEALLVKKRFNLKLNKISDEKLANMIALINSFIIGVTFIIIEFIDNFILKIMVSFVVLTILILVLYMLLGKYLKRKEG